MEEIISTPLVSICSITFNHVNYIRQCLDGMLMQKCNFSFEIIINDDCSNDGTTEILREYADKYPNIVKPIYHEENLYRKGERGFFSRFVFPRAQGKYIAICEGDDYWTDPLKLQKQVDFLETHPKHSLCFCAHDNLFPDGNIIHEHRYEKTIESCPMSDLILGGGGYMATASMMYKQNILLSFPDWAKNLPVGDLPLMLVCAMNGCVGYINDNMVVYRRNSVGSWSNRMSTNISMIISSHKPIRNMWKNFDVATNKKYHKIIKKKIYINDKSFTMQVICYYLRKVLRK